VPHHQLVEHLERVVGLEVGLTTAVEAHGDAVPLARGPDRVVVRVVPRTTVDTAGVHEHRLEPELLHAAGHLLRGEVGVVRCEQTGAEEPRRVLTAEVVEPVVVRTRDGGGVVALESVGAHLVHVVEAEHEQAPAGEQHRHVEALVVHGREL
jgi:hypothetical protein